MYNEALGQSGPTKKWIKPKDPLNNLVKIFFVLMGAAIVGCFIGYAYTIITVLTALFGLAWLKSPARSYPTAEVNIKYFPPHMYLRSTKRAA